MLIKPRPVCFSVLYLCLGTRLIVAQEIKWEEVPERTGVKIICDTPDVPIYIDGHLVGKSPLPDVVDVMPGWHRISYFPDLEESLEDQYPKGRRIQDILSMGGQDVLVEKGEIVSVVLAYQGLDKVVREYQRKVNSSQWVGFSMLLIVLIILAWVA